MWRRSPTRRSSAAALSVLALAAGCGSKSESHVISVSGHIGPLQVDHSDRAAVIHFAGPPSAERNGRYGGAPPYRALGYDCSASRARETVPLGPGGPYCRTAFFLARNTGKLAVFFTTTREYSESHGVHLGMSQAAAERRLHRRLTVGCTTALYFSTGTAALSISFGGGIEHGTSIKGAHVDAFVVHGMNHDPDIFDCL